MSQEQNLIDVLAVIDAFDACDFELKDGQVAWVRMPFQADAVHETAFERLLALAARIEEKIPGSRAADIHRQFPVLKRLGLR